MPSCPTCGDAAALRTELLEEPGLRAGVCGACGGVWLELKAYEEWLARSDAAEQAPAEPVPLEALRDGPFLRRCPECRYILGRYRVRHDVPFTLDRCHNCRGVWLDAREWAALKDHGLHRQLHAIFTEDWQANVRRRAATAREERRLRRALGEDYERVIELRDWLDAHPERDLILGLLLDRPRPFPGRPEDAQAERLSRAWRPRTPEA